MTAWLAAIGSWNWFILGALLLLLELLLPGTFMMWLAFAAIIVGVVSVLIDWTWQVQVIAFGVLSIASIPAWRRFARKVETPVDAPFLNRRAEGYVGRAFVLEKPIVNGAGTLRIDDTVWRISGADAAAGSRIRVVATEGSSLRVEPA